MRVKARYAPSPTGIPHVGNIRTALFNYFLAKANGGKFILRIEDTDQARKVEGALEAIKESLTWIGAEWDEVIVQSERLDTYKKYVQQLLDKGLAVKDGEAVRFIVSKDGETSWIDLVGNKKISFQNSQIEDFIILKSDGFPTYHLANVVDDHEMGITHVLRGEDWISSTPKHIMLYQAFLWELPTFVHVPNVNGPDGKKLSKRFGAKSVLDFKKDGYLAESLLNYLMLLGWSPKNDQEILSKEEIIKQFSLQGINSSPAIFSETKLEWMNGEYIRMMSDEELTIRLQEFLVDHPSKNRIAAVVPLIKERIKKLSDFVPLTDFLFEKPEYEKVVFERIIKDPKRIKELLENIEKTMEKLKSPWQSQEFTETFKKFAQDHNLSTTETFQLIRVAISGQTVTPPLFESINFLGFREALNRIKEACKLF